MPVVKSIVRVETKTSKLGKKYTLTWVRLESGDEEYSFYGQDIKPGQRVTAYHDDKWGVLKVEKIGDDKL